MSMKRFLCILVTICFIISACVATAENENKKITFTVTDEGDAICLTTSLLPEQKTTIYRAENGDVEDIFALIRPEVLPRLLLCFREAVLDLNKERASTHEGSYAGDLFEHAITKEEIELTGEAVNNLISETAGRFQNTLDETTGASLQPETLKKLEQVLRSIAGKVFDTNTRARISTYDRKYFTIDIIRGEEVMIALSADLSGTDGFHILLARRAADSVFYEELTCDESPEGIEYASSLFRSEAPAFRMISEQDCVQFAEIRFTGIAGEDYAFEGGIQSVLFESSLHIKGNRTQGAQGRGTISTELEAEGQGSEFSEQLIPMLNSILQLKP